MAFEIPLEAQRIESRAVSCVRGLEGEEDWDCIDCVFKTSAKKSGKVRVGENPSIAQAGVKGSGVAPAAGDGMSTARPKFDFVSAFFRAGLGEAWNRDQQRKCQKNRESTSIH